MTRAEEIDAWVAAGRDIPDEALAVFLAHHGYPTLAAELERHIARRGQSGPSERVLDWCPVCERYTANLTIHHLDRCGR